MVLSASGGVFLEGDVEHPVQLVFDGPMRARDFDQPFGGQRSGQKEPAFDRWLVPTSVAAARFHLPHRRDAGEVEGFGGHHDRVSNFRAIMGRA